jgi:hypothetical protein
LPKSVEKLHFWLQGDFDDEKLLVLVLNWTVPHIKVGHTDGYKMKIKLFKGFLDINQQSEGIRTRKILGWKFRVSSNNRILNL